MEPKSKQLCLLSFLSNMGIVDESLRSILKMKIISDQIEEVEGTLKTIIDSYIMKNDQQVEV